jgi:hypothetical protein
MMKPQKESQSSIMKMLIANPNSHPRSYSAIMATTATPANPTMLRIMVSFLQMVPD